MVQVNTPYQLVQNQVDPENEEVIFTKFQLQLYKNRLGNVCSSDQDTDTEIRAITAVVGKTSSYGQQSSITSSESSIGGDIIVGCTSQTFYSNCPSQYRSDYCPFPSTPWYASEFLCSSSPYGYNEVQGMYGYNYSPAAVGILSADHYRLLLPWTYYRRWYSRGKGQGSVFHLAATWGHVQHHWVDSWLTSTSLCSGPSKHWWTTFPSGQWLIRPKKLFNY